jgi:putative transposase
MAANKASSSPDAKLLITPGDTSNPCFLRMLTALLIAGERWDWRKGYKLICAARNTMPPRYLLLIIQYIMKFIAAKTGRYSEAQVFRILKEVESGMPVVNAAREHGVSPATIHRWESKYGGMTLPELKRLKALDNELLKEINSKKW